MRAMCGMASEIYAPAPASSTIERLSREQLERLQEDRLIALFQRTWEHVSFYRKRWQERKRFGPMEIRRLADLQKLPVINKRDLEADLLACPPFGTYQGDFSAVRVQASSRERGGIPNLFHTAAIGKFSPTSGRAACMRRVSRKVTSSN